jgi:opacity protein-like surface antigen
MKSTKTRIMLGLAGMLVAAIPVMAQETLGAPDAASLKGGGVAGGITGGNLTGSTLMDTSVTDNRLRDKNLGDGSLADSRFEATLAESRLEAGVRDSLLADRTLQDSYWGRDRPSRRSYDRRNEFRLWLGGFRPDATGPYFNSVKRDFTFSNSDLDDVIFGADYILHITPNVGLIFSGSYYQGSGTQAYRDFTDQHGAAIRHDTALDISTFTAGVIFHFAPQYPVDPYIGGGGGIYAYRLREAGDFVDFGQPTLPVFSDTLESNGTAFGYFILAGVDFRVSHTVSLFAEGRLSRANKNLTGDFQGAGKINLDGKQIAGGISWHL